MRVHSSSLAYLTMDIAIEPRVKTVMSPVIIWVFFLYQAWIVEVLLKYSVHGFMVVTSNVYVYGCLFVSHLECEWWSISSGRNTSVQKMSRISQTFATRIDTFSGPLYYFSTRILRRLPVHLLSNWRSYITVKKPGEKKRYSKLFERLSRWRMLRSVEREMDEKECYRMRYSGRILRKWSNLCSWNIL